MERIPDDILLLVFGCVDIPLLVTEIRAVCHKWRDLALHRDAWKNRRVSTFDVKDGWARILSRILLLAPCLSELIVDPDDISESIEELMCTTTCSVKKLTISISDEDVDRFAKETIRNQVSNGRLRSLCLRVWCSGPKCKGIFRIIKDLHLEELAVENQQDDDTTLDYEPTRCGLWGTGSLKRLAYNGNVSDTLFSFLLRVRADTLEDLDVCLSDISQDSAASLDDLYRCKNLERVALHPVVTQVRCLESCPKMTSLTLDCNLQKAVTQSLPQIRRAHLSTVLVAYFRSSAAARLTHLTLTNNAERYSSELLMEALSALAVGRESMLEWLKLQKLFDADMVDQLALVLLGLPRLRELMIHNKPSPKLLDAICPGTAPSMLLFSVTTCVSMTPCEWVALTRLVHKNPRLHVQLATCQSCELSNMDSRPQAVGVFGHPGAENCGMHRPDVVWLSAL